MDSNNKAMDNVQGTFANRSATIVDLQELLHMVWMEFARLCATNNSEPPNPHVVETNNDIQALYQEMARLQESTIRREGIPHGHA